MLTLEEAEDIAKKAHQMREYLENKNLRITGKQLEMIIARIIRHEIPDIDQLLEDVQ